MQRPGRTGPVLVVDDDQDIRETLTIVLEHAGFTVAAARHGQDALTQLQAGLRPGLILLDLLMPVMTGAEFRLAQLEDATLAEIPVIVLSAHLRGPAVAPFAGMHYLSKPLHYGRLLALMRQLYRLEGDLAQA